MTDEIGAAAMASDDTSRIQRATEAIREMADDLKPAAEGLQPVVRRVTDEICNLTRHAPLQSLAIAFLLGVMVAHRRR
jgi:hypothetical protein